MLPLPGADKEGVIAFRNISDCKLMIEAAKSYKKAVVIGGGLLGLEAARGLLNLKMDVDVVHIADHLMDRQLDSEAGDMLKAELEQQGMRFHLNKKTVKINGHKRVTSISFSDQTSLKADLVVMAVGVRPNVQLARESGWKSIKQSSSMTIWKRVKKTFMQSENVPNIVASFMD